MLWYSASFTVPGFNVVCQDVVSLPLWARSCFYVQRLFCYVLALFATAAAVGVVQP